ncbi:hypothetical protein KW429_11095 [Vibrio fluvialis]|nr:hypothetical protein [Vibrio fluvialis]MBY7902398.1 hypothetical protein [Vibrio fluvialis]
MHTNSKIGTVVLAIGLLSTSVNAELMTVAEFEQQQKEIMNSSAENAEKFKEIQNLSALFDATQALKAKIDAAKHSTLPSTGQNDSAHGTQQQIAKPNDMLSASNTLRQQLEQKILDEIFLTELGVIGPIGKAEIIAQNRKYPVDLAEAIATKRTYGNYTIKSFTDDSVTVAHIKTHKNKVLLLEDSATISAQIKFNRELFNKYAEKALMGQLDVEITNQATSTLPTPQSIIY